MNEINVLLVEDEPTLAMIIKDTLEAQGFCIRLAADGEDGLRRMAEQMPDVLVADVMMPHMDGFEMVRRMRQTDTTTPVLFLSARSAVSDVVEGFGLGADDYLKKPFGMQELMVRIRALAMRGQRMAATAPPAPGQEMVIGRYRLNTLTQQLCHDATARRACCACWPNGVDRWWRRATSCNNCGATTAFSTPAACRFSSPSCAIGWPPTQESASSTCAASATNWCADGTAFD